MILIYVALAAIIIGSVTDIRTREVPDWLNYALIAVGFGGNAIYSLYYGDILFIQRSIIGFAAAFAIGTVMYYTGQWGGGDSKMIFGLGAALGLSYPFQMDFFLMFLINILFSGAIYGILWIVASAVARWRKVSARAARMMRQYRKFRIISAAISFAGLAILYFLPIESAFKFIFSGMIIFLYFMGYLFIFVKSVEDVVMIQRIDPGKLTEGDWIVDDIVVDGKTIASPRDLGVRKEQINQMMDLRDMGKLKTIKVKYGIPFVPSFLLAFLYTLILDKTFIDLILGITF